MLYHLSHASSMTIEFYPKKIVFGFVKEVHIYLEVIFKSSTMVDELLQMVFAESRDTGMCLRYSKAASCKIDL
jgi:hypothetical protein